MPPAKVRIGPIYVDPPISQYLEEVWRREVDEANRKGEKIKPFGQFVAEILTGWVGEHRRREWSNKNIQTDARGK